MANNEKTGLSVVVGLAVLSTGLVLALGSLRMFTDQEAEAQAQAQTPPQPAAIDGDRAMGYLRSLCALGPRPAGSAANTRQRQMVADHFRKLGGAIREQPFKTRDPISGKSVEMANLIGSWFPDRTERVVIGAHYDTRPFPDRDPDPARRKAVFLGANDGASGVALLMEIAHHLNDSPTPYGVDLVLFDGEELVYDDVGEYFLGSREFARVYARDRERGRARQRYVAGVVLDMVGDKNLALPQEPYSLELAPTIVRQIWSVAARLNAPQFIQKVSDQAVSDDHLALNHANIPTVDIIDFDYPYWHTAGDLPDQCSGESLKAVGRVVTAWLAEPKSSARKKR